MTFDRLLLVLFAATSFVPSFARAQAPIRVQFAENADGTIHITPAATLVDGATIFTQFGASKGAFLNGVVAMSPVVPQTCQVAPANPVNSCFYWTGDCRSCGQDPHAFPGEVSCFCKKVDPAWAVNDLFSVIPNGPGADLELGLTTDQDGNGTIDQDLFSKVTANPTGDQMRLYQLNSELARIDWEDIAQGPNGDFNDLTFYMSGRDCESELNGFPIMTLEAAEGGRWLRGCRPDECNPPLDPDCLYNSYLDEEEIEFTVSVAVDRENSEHERESSGRKLFVTVATYAEANFQGIDLVMCPALLIDRPNVTDPIFGLGYGMRPGFDSASCDDEPDTGAPICSDKESPSLPGDLEFFALARDQLYTGKDSCGPRSGEGDILWVQPPQDVRTGSGMCTLKMPHIETYEVSLKQMGLAMNESLDSMTAQDVLDLIIGVELRYFPYPHVSEFYCPSGWNVRISTVDQSIGYMQDALIPDTINALNYTEIIRD